MTGPSLNPYQLNFALVKACGDDVELKIYRGSGLAISCERDQQNNIVSITIESLQQLVPCFIKWTR